MLTTTTTHTTDTLGTSNGRFYPRWNGRSIRIRLMALLLGLALIVPAAVTEAAPAAGGVSGEPFVAGNACADAELSLFKYWFNTYTNYDTWGTHDKSGTGEKFGNTTIVLGNTSAGVLVMCPLDETSATPTMEIEEYVAGLGWKRIHKQGFMFDGFAYGYRFNGPTIRKLRMTIRDYDGHRFFWGASY